MGGGLLEDGEVERIAADPYVRGKHGGADAITREDAVLVGFAEGVVSGVEVFGDGFDREDANAWGKGAVEGAMEVGGGDGYSEGEGGDLGEGVDPGVGAARALRQDGLARDVVDYLRESALDGGEVGLDLPTVVGGPVVGEDELPVRHGDDLDGITMDCLTPIGTDDTD